MLKRLSWLIYPPHCRSCNDIIDSEAIFCAQCKSRLKLVVPIFVPLTQRQSLNVYAACAYQDPARSLIYKKFSYDTLACNQMADLMFDFIPFESINPDFFVPVPLHWTRFAWRGYNQADLMATRLGRRLGVPVANILKRNRRTIFQSKLSAQERQKNVENVFLLDIKAQDFKGKNLVIVDDLYTSGATVKNAAKVLQQLKPNSISVVVFCRAI